MSEKNTNQQSYRNNVAEKAAAAKELLDNVLSDAVTVLVPDKYIAFLNLIEQFHWYSFVNNLLLLSQYPDAKYLAGYDVWKRICLATYNDPTRRILSSSSVGKGIKLIAPFTVVDGSNRSLINVLVPVYDVNQMNDIPPPKNDFLDITKCNYVDIINAIDLVSPYQKVIAADDDSILSHKQRGYCDHQMQKIIIDNRLSAAGHLSALLHEFIEAELFVSGYTNESLHLLVSGSIYYILLKHFGLPVEDITFSYVSRFSKSSLSDIIDAFQVIQSLAHSIIESVENELEDIVNLSAICEDLSYQPNFFDDVEFRQGSNTE